MQRQASSLRTTIDRIDVELANILALITKLGVATAATATPGSDSSPSSSSPGWVDPDTASTKAQANDMAVTDQFNRGLVQGQWCLCFVLKGMGQEGVH